MSTVHQVDVLVVGLGPAGASAAAAAARAGLTVRAIEKRREIGVPVQCAEFIPLPLGARAQGEGIVRQRVAGMTTRLPSGASAHADFPGLMIDRAVFDRALAEEARMQGAELRLGSILAGLDCTAHIAAIRTGSEECLLRYRVLIAADGPRSTVGRLMGLPQLPVLHTRQYAVPLKAKQTDTDVWLSDTYAGGYAWLFPKGEVANLGVGGDASLDLKPALDDLHRQLIESGRVGAEILFRTGGEIPVGGMREHLALGDTVFVGDAAGLTHPITGAGIAAAVASGERAGEAASGFLQGNANALCAFESDMREQYQTSLARAVVRRAELWESSPRDEAAHRRGWVGFAVNGVDLRGFVCR